LHVFEARTPPDSLYKTIPADLEYANDYKALNKYCDRVKLMTYDQERADLKLNASAKGLYAPIADPAWVTKVVNLAAKDIAKSKLQIGVATYGYIYQIMPYDDGTGYSYDLLEAFNPKYATDLAASLNIHRAQFP
jgi:spore germination protein YaaH